MKLLGLLILSLSLPSFAANPLIRTCRVTGGEFHIIQVNKDQVGFCEYGDAIIDALTVLQITSGQGASLAAQAVLAEGSTCEENGGEVRPSPDLENFQFYICQLHDGSAIELGTLQGGVNRPESQALIKALRTRF